MGYHDEPYKGYTEIRICGMCGGEVNEVSSGDEGWSVCDDCGTVEGNNMTVYICDECDLEVLEPDMEQHTENHEEAKHERHYKGESNAWDGGFADNH